MTKKQRYAITDDSLDELETIIRTNKEQSGVDFQLHAIDIRKVVIESNQRVFTLQTSDIDDEGKLLPDNDTLKHKRKAAEYDSLLPLSKSIKEKSLQNPISVYKKNDKLILKTGQRRLLATLIAGHRSILARVWSKVPDHYEIEIDQWIENFNREGLATKDSVSAVKKIAFLWCEKNKRDISVTELAKVIYCSKAQAVKYHAFLSAPDEIEDAINTGKLTNLKKAYELCKIEDSVERKNLLADVISGELTQDMIERLVSTSRGTNEQTCGVKKQVTGRSPKRITLGYTKSTEIVQDIVSAILEQKKYESLNNDFKEIKDISWDYRAASNMFKKLLSSMEKISNG